MRTILDEGVPEALTDFLTGHGISTVKQQGWRGINNGRLLALIERAGFQAVITNDKRLEREQDLTCRPFGTLIYRLQTGILSASGLRTSRLRSTTPSPA